MTGPAVDIDLRVVNRHDAAEGVVLFELAAATGTELPAWAPGAHLDLTVPGTDLIRQYSLCGDPADRTRYRIAVLEEPDGRGGSAAMCQITAGQELRVRAVRNHFALAPSARYVFIAGGIGITPLIPMINAAQTAGADWELHYAGASQRRMAFAETLAAAYPARVHLYPKDEGARLGLAEAVPAVGAEVYACGPARLLDALVANGGACGLHIERFVASAEGEPLTTTDDAAFEVYFARSDLTITVGPDKSILAAGEAAGADVFGSCLEGICGTCETAVIEGTVDHRDQVLNGEDTGTMMICVSRAACPRLVLDA